MGVGATQTQLQCVLCVRGKLRIKVRTLQICAVVRPPQMIPSGLHREMLRSCFSPRTLRRQIPKCIYSQVMLLKLNKEGPFKKDVFRAPGHQGNMRKLVHFLQQVSAVIWCEIFPYLNDATDTYTTTIFL